MRISAIMFSYNEWFIVNATKKIKERNMEFITNASFEEWFGNIEISEALKRQILPYAQHARLTILNSRIAVVITSRSEWGTSGGIGYWDQARVFFGSQVQMQEWQYRDRYSANNDKPWLRIDAIGSVKVSEEGETTVITIELLNNQHGSRIVKFTFDKSEPEKPPTLSEQQQTSFIAKVEQETARILEDKMRLWERKPLMLPFYVAAGVPGNTRYLPPCLNEQVVRSDIGVAAFVIEEQIDHRAGGERQMQHELYVLKINDEKAVQLAEDHGYDKADRGAFLKILEFDINNITINSKTGKHTISLIQQ